MSANLSGWSGSAVSVGLAGFTILTGHWGWGIFFAVLAVILAGISSK